MNKRIVGLETEYSLFFLDKTVGKLLGGRELEKVFEEAAKELGFSEWLENGGRLYVDHGGHPEYATPECASALDAVKYEKAGERIMEKIGDYLNEKSSNQGMFYFHKDNSDRKGDSFGSHENYLIRAQRGTASLWFDKIIPILITFLATRQIFCGAGKIGLEAVRSTMPELSGFYAAPFGSAYVQEAEEEFDPDLRAGVFQISQRADFLYSIKTASNVDAKGFLAEKGDNHCDEEFYQRLHITCGDSNMSEYSAWLKIATTLAVLEMIEGGFVSEEDAPILANPVGAVKEILRDPSLTAKVFLENGDQMTAIEIQKWFLGQAREYAARIGGIDLNLLVEWDDVLDKLEKSPRLLANKIDWIIKRELIEKYKEERQLEWKDPAVLSIDIEYHNIQRNQGIYYLLEQNWEVMRLLEESKIANAVYESPQDTRAILRSAFVKMTKKFKLVNLSINWGGFGRIMTEDISTKDPWEFSYQQAAKLLKLLADIAEELQFK